MVCTNWPSGRANVGVTTWAKENNNTESIESIHHTPRNEIPLSVLKNHKGEDEKEGYT